MSKCKNKNRFVIGVQKGFQIQSLHIFTSHIGHIKLAYVCSADDDSDQTDKKQSGNNKGEGSDLQDWANCIYNLPGGELGTGQYCLHFVCYGIIVVDWVKQQGSHF